jgi:DNA-binding LacI/PurR family transcriptional regulator
MDGLPLYIQVRNSIREGIEKGSIKPNSDGVLPSQEQFASHFNVGVATVKRAIKDLENTGLVMSRRGKGLTLNAALQKNFEDISAGRRMPIIGVALFDITGRMSSPYFRRIMSGIEACTEENHAILHVVSLPGVEMEMQEDAYLSSISLLNMDGMLVLSPVSSGFIAQLMKREIPYVAVNVLADRGEVCHVQDFVSSSFRVLDAVFDRGRGNVIVFNGEESKLSSCLKSFGYKLAFAKHGLEPSSDRIYYEDYDHNHAIQIVKQVLDSGKQLDAVVAYDDMMGGDIHDFLESIGREDILVAGFGNYSSFEEKVTITADERLREMGYNAMKTLSGMMSGEKPERTKFCYDAILIERDRSEKS